MFQRVNQCYIGRSRLQTPIYTPITSKARATVDLRLSVEVKFLFAANIYNGGTPDQIITMAQPTMPIYAGSGCQRDLNNLET